MAEPEEKPKLISLDNGKTKIAKADEDVLRSAATGEGLVPIPPHFFSQEFREKLLSSIDKQKAELREKLSEEQMKFIRKCRVDDGCSWRAVAQECYDAFGELSHSDESWSRIPSNQIMGMQLCEVAAEFFGEQSMEDLW